MLEVSLRKAGFTVTPASSVTDALDKLELHTPDLIISETKFPTDLDGFELRRRLRAASDWADIPFVFLTTETAIENKIRGLELGVEDYLTKPIYIKEIVTRINILLQKKQRAGFEARKDGVRFAGRVADMPVVDVIQTIEISRKSGLIHFVGFHGRTAAIYFRDGKVIDAEAGTLQGEDAVYRLLTWSEGEFEVEFRTVRRREAIATSSQGLLMEGMRRLDEWTRLLEQLPPLVHRFEVDAAELSIRLGDVPDEQNRILRLFDGKRSLLEVIDASDFGDLECLQAISRLYFEGMLLDLDPDQPARRDTGKPMPLVQIDEAPTPMEEVASGPIAIPDATQPVDAEDVIEETDYIEPGPLGGDYRPSSLRLIDEAVAAAQAIEPSLFEPQELAAAGVPLVPASSADSGPSALAKMQLAVRTTDPRVITARDLIEKVPDRSDDDPREQRGSNGASRSGGVARSTTLEAPDPAELAAEAAVPTAIGADEPQTAPAPVPQRPHRESDRPEDSGERRRFAATIRREDSGLRMIGSHGRDRAEASGELRMPLPPEPMPTEPQRELVTIMPRRRDSQAEAEAAPAAAVEPAVPAPPKPAPAPASPAPAQVALPPRQAETPPRRVSTRPGPGASAMLVLAVVLAGVTTFMYCHKKQAAHAPAAQRTIDAPAPHVVMTVTPDAEAPQPLAIDAAVAPPPVPIDAAQIVHAPPPVPHDAGAAAVETPVDRAKAAKELFDQAHAALEDGDADRALQLANQSLKYRRTANTLLERARALQRLDRVDESLTSIDEALSLVSDYPAAYAQRAMLLWSARRYDEARDEMTKYVQRYPNGSATETFKRLLDEPR